MKRSFAVLAAVLSSSGAAALFVACGGSDGAGLGGDADASSDGTAGGDAIAADGGSDDAADEGDAGPAAKCPDWNALKNPYFGDLHSHTSYSFDAYTFDTRNAPLDAYAFARGKTVQVAGAAPDGGGPMTTIERKLDFLAITDHSEWLALSYGCGAALDGTPYDPQSAYYDAGACAMYRSTDPTTQGKTFGGAKLLQDALCDGGQCPAVVRSAWAAEQQAAASAYAPCKFTSFVAYEWTHVIAGATLHKNVIFGSSKVPDAPIDSFNYPTQPALWSALDQQCVEANGCEAITIPHNSNLSQGGAFTIPAGSEQHAQKYQRLVEIFQHKGGSECFYDPQNPTDPACNFEYLGGVTEPNLPASYVRNAFGKGIQAYAANKVNPLQMGVVASTDDHNGAPGNVAETTWPGHAGRLDDSPDKRIGQTADGGVPGASVGHNPGGVAVAWAEENTRASLFAAFKRRETYGTSGPRIVVRFYQTWDTADPCADPNFPAGVVASGGVPMGATFALPSADGGAASPRFVVYAWKDKVDLARLDIVKGWIDAQGQVQEKVVAHDVTAGQPACFVWTDSEFAPGPTFYYARVLETPTRRWSSYDCANAQNPSPTACADGGVLNTPIQERAWTSPIWYLP